MKLPLAQCAEWMGGELRGGDSAAVVQGYGIDSRTLVPGELFFAVSGERFDAHQFVPAALGRGAAAVVVSRPSGAGAEIVVDDPLGALQRLGAAVRQAWGGTVIGLTGSAGKTTTKEMTAAVLGAHHPVLKTAGNLNNHFGVPLTLVRLEPEHRYAVVEMGMSNRGEIGLLASLARPDWGVVTNVGAAHAGNFPDGVEGVAAAKRELVEALPASGLAFLNADDARVARFASATPARSVLAGRAENAAVRGSKYREDSQGLSFRVSARGEEAEVRLRFLGEHNAGNALLALAVGLEAGVPLAEGARALGALSPGDKRGQVLEIRGAHVINDCYNSNPAALRAMVRTLLRLPAERHIVIAGEMLELGADTGALHAEAGREAAALGADWVVGVQGAALALAEAAAAAGTLALFFETPEEAGAWLRRELRPGDAVLLKGSRGVRLERALEGLP